MSLPKLCSANRWQPHELRDIEAVFADLDRGGVGGFDAADVQRLLDEMGDEVPPHELRQFMAELDPNNSGVVLFGAFLDAVDKLPENSLQFSGPPPGAASATSGSLAPIDQHYPQARRAMSPGRTVKW